MVAARIAAGFLVASTAGMCAAPGRADDFQLKGGGELVGEVVEQGASGKFVVRTDDGAQVTVERRDIERMTHPDAAAAEHRRRSRAAPDAADAHRELAAWCKEHGLAAEAAVHWQRVVDLAPDDEAARQALGYARVGAQWLNRDQIMAARGLVFFDGRYRTPQDIALRKWDAEQSGAEVDWFTRIRLWRDWLRGRRPDRVEEAQAQIAAIDDASAAPALIKLMGQEGDPWIFGMLLDALGRLDHPQATETLVMLSLDNASSETRLRCLEYLAAGDRRVSIVPYVQALGSKDRRVINRAGRALGHIGDPAAISPLIDALVTRHKFQLQPGSDGQIGAAFDPSGQGGGGLSFGGSAPKVVERDLENSQVHAALVKLVGSEDFGYDEAAWRRWFVNEQLHEQINARRDE